MVCMYIRVVGFYVGCQMSQIVNLDSNPNTDSGVKSHRAIDT